MSGPSTKELRQKSLLDMMREPMTVKELAEKHGYNVYTVYRDISEMEKDGRVGLHPIPKHGAKAYVVKKFTTMPMLFNTVTGETLPMGLYAQSHANRGYAWPVASVSVRSLFDLMIHMLHNAQLAASGQFSEKGLRAELLERKQELSEIKVRVQMIESIVHQLENHTPLWDEDLIANVANHEAFPTNIQDLVDGLYRARAEERDVL